MVGDILTVDHLHGVDAGKDKVLGNLRPQPTHSEQTNLDAFTNQNTVFTNITNKIGLAVCNSRHEASNDITIQEEPTFAALSLF